MGQLPQETRDRLRVCVLSPNCVCEGSLPENSYSLLLAAGKQLPSRKLLKLSPPQTKQKG